MVMARQPGLTVRVIRRKAEDQEADDRARENKARGDDENVDALLAAKADPSLKDAWGRTPSEEAERAGHAAVRAVTVHAKESFHAN